MYENLHRESKMSSSNEDDDPGEQSGLDCMIRASCLDDWGASRGIVECIMGICWTRFNSRGNDCSVGHDQDMGSVPVVSEKTQQIHKLSPNATNI